MNCYRCGFIFSGNQCQICGKYAPTETDPIGADSEELRIAVVFPNHEELTTDLVSQLQASANYYQTFSDPEAEQHVFVYTPLQAVSLFELLQKTDLVQGRSILFNGRLRPYDSDLWLPMLWFLAQ